MCIMYLRLKKEIRKYSSEYLQMHNCMNYFNFFFQIEMHLLELLDECHSREDLNLYGLKKLNLKKLILKQLMSKLFKFPNQSGCRLCI